MATECFFDVKIGTEEPERVEFVLYDDVVPKTAKNFSELCKKSTPDGYKNSIFHRIIPRFMAQGGDITNGNGYGGKSIYGEKFSDENFIKKHNKKYLLSMANSGKNSNGSQFFITFVECDWLDNAHVVFGEVKGEPEILKKLEAVGSNSGKTKKPVIVVDSGVLKE
ncbi:peptidyl-prolyl cis-trans isomerase [Vairimorpha necatrix]|uniref:Peptidyl-prolyl cis-trans isomerase n=1 Tax=Vairimorpha necatrix TaxID=6039 RepID=A0AAX4JAY0_9MICR